MIRWDSVVCPIASIVYHGYMLNLVETPRLRDIYRQTTQPSATMQSAFKASKLNSTTFLIIEHSDSYDEHPYIYAKLIPQANTILILDTGCGGRTDDPKIELTSLREFIETVEVDARYENGDSGPLNEGGKMGYVVVLSHCHYDHICAFPITQRGNERWITNWFMQ